MFTVATKLVVSPNNIYPDRGLSVVPTQEWQNNLARSLCSSASSSSPPYYTRMSPLSDEPAPRRRRLDTAPNDSRGHPDWNEMYTLEALSGEIDLHQSLTFMIIDSPRSRGKRRSCRGDRRVISN